jgi:hypothetical protein
MISRRGVASEVATEEVGVRTGKGEEEAAEEEEEEEKEEKLQQQHQLEERAGTEVPVGEGTICKGRQQGGGGGGGGGVGGSVWSSLVSGTFAILEGRTEVEGGGGGGGGGGWDFGVKRVVQCGPMRRLQERFLGQKWYTSAASASGSAIWVLGVCYNISSTDESVSSPVIFQEFLNDFSSRLWFTYRRGLSVCLLHVLTSFFCLSCMCYNILLCVLRRSVVQGSGEFGFPNAGICHVSSCMSLCSYEDHNCSFLFALLALNCESIAACMQEEGSWIVM